MSGESLKKCPFCRSQPEATKRVGRRFIVECDFCTAVGPRRSTRDGAADAWNLRSVPIIAAPDAPVSMCSRCHATWPLDQAPPDHYLECKATPTPITPSAVAEAGAEIAAYRSVLAPTDVAVEAVVARAFGADEAPSARERIVAGRIMHAVRELVASRVGVPDAVAEAEQRGREAVVAWLLEEVAAVRSKHISLGETVRGGPLDGASVYNLNAFLWRYLEVRAAAVAGEVSDIPPATESEAGRG